jgi:hypothetical protein
MSAPDDSGGSLKYYDTAEVEAYISDATTAIAQLQERLQQATARAEAAEQRASGTGPDTASLGRALLLASEVADKTIAEADERAREVLRQAEKDAAAVLEAARREAAKLVEAATQAAAEQAAQVRLPENHPFLAAVDGFLRHIAQVREDLLVVEREAELCRTELSEKAGRASGGPGGPRPAAAPLRAPQAFDRPEPVAPAADPPDSAGGPVENGRDGDGGALASFPPPIGQPLEYHWRADAPDNHHEPPSFGR